MANTKEKNYSFEEAIAELEDITQRLEGGSLSLDESIKEYERAVALVRLCEEKLSVAKQRVRILIEAADGTVSDAGFSAKDGDAT